MSGRGREVSTTEQSEVRALRTGLSSPTSTQSSESHPTHSCLTILNPAVPVMVPDPLLSSFFGAHQQSLCNRTSGPIHRTALEHSWWPRGWRWQWLWFGEFLRFSVRKLGSCLWFHCFSFLLHEPSRHLWLYITPQTPVLK